jgi:hypothetical protein
VGNLGNEKSRVTAIPWISRAEIRRFVCRKSLEGKEIRAGALRR